MRPMMLGGMADVAKTYESGDGSVTTNDRGAVEGDDGWQVRVNSDFRRSAIFVLFYGF